MKNIFRTQIFMPSALHHLDLHIVMSLALAPAYADKEYLT